MINSNHVSMHDEILLFPALSWTTLFLLSSHKPCSSLTPTLNPGAPLFRVTLVFCFLKLKPWFSSILVNISLLLLQPLTLVLLCSREHFSSLSPTLNPGSPFCSWTLLFYHSNSEPWCSSLLMNLALLLLQPYTLVLIIQFSYSNPPSLVLLFSHDPCLTLTPRRIPCVF